ncbi:NUDIX domain-containing protein [Hirsutella rhossiliensis]|uniref:NUDIX domain-containing protein n=1 Tax=Hirsutella rhossiliensis TaxID=111463 RepID=A0A9P8MPD9_9HYPO|nr:NUDIX domain-containing protein [Hirsutella rhossiliensis]KAH0958840.1 NUDIX domain-containing protein [Hirsutella rhossiliensis]
MAQPAPSAQEAASGFDFDTRLAEWDVPAKTWLASNEAKLRQRRLKLDGLATGAVVFNPEGKVLVIQRASHDTMPDRWEIPGGAVDQDDPTILHGAARELWEEAGLVATHFRQLATEDEDGPGGDLAVFSNRDGTRWFCRFAFHVDVASCQDIRLDPAEHQAFTWASEEEIREQRVGSRDMPITHKSMQGLILRAFKSRR